MTLLLLQPTRTVSLSENNDSSHDTRRPMKFDGTIHLSNIFGYQNTGINHETIKIVMHVVNGQYGSFIKQYQVYRSNSHPNVK